MRSAVQHCTVAGEMATKVNLTGAIASLEIKCCRPFRSALVLCALTVHDGCASRLTTDGAHLRIIAPKNQAMALCAGFGRLRGIYRRIPQITAKAGFRREDLAI